MLTDRSAHRIPPRVGIGAAVLVLLAANLACNFPAAGKARPGRISTHSLEQTLQAGGAPEGATPGALPPASPSPQQPPPQPQPAVILPTGQAAPQGAFPGLETATPGSPVAVVLPPLDATLPAGQPELPPYQYAVQTGDTLFNLAQRFGVSVEEITSAQPLAPEGLLEPGQVLVIPNKTGQQAVFPSAVMPDSEVVDSPTAVSLDLPGYIAQAGGFLSSYSETQDKQKLSGADVVRRVSLETSINPRILLAFLEYRSHWVTGQPSADQILYPLGFYVTGYTGLYKELSLSAKLLNVGYYGWRAGTRTVLDFKDGSHTQISPTLNAGSVAVQYLFARLYAPGQWVNELYGPRGFLAIYNQMFGDPWQRAAGVEPLYRPGLQQPALDLPFAPGERWALTSGPHIAWNTGTPLGALDFAPITGEHGCGTSIAWVTAPVGGVVVRSENGVLTLDLDGDGREETGWVLMFLHLASSERAASGTQIQPGDHLGHPSCEGGSATGIHVHVARKYNGEWIPADGALPFVLSGWTAHAGERPYQGTLTLGDQVVTAQPDGSHGSTIIRQQ